MIGKWILGFNDDKNWTLSFMETKILSKLEIKAADNSAYLHSDMFKINTKR